MCQLCTEVCLNKLRALYEVGWDFMCIQQNIKDFPQNKIITTPLVEHIIIVISRSETIDLSTGIV